MFFRLGLLNVRRNLGRSMLSLVSMAVAAAVLTSALFLATGYPGQAYLPLRVFAGGDIMIFPRALSLGSGGTESPEQDPPEGSGTLGYTFGQLERDWISDLQAYHPEAFDYGVLHRGELPWFDVEEITARLAALPVVVDVYPYYTLPAFEVAADPLGGGNDRSGLGALRGRDVEKDRDLFYFQDYVTYGRPLAPVDEGRLRCLIDTGRTGTPGYGALGFIPGSNEVLIPEVTFVPGAGRALFDYSKGTTYTLQTVGGYRCGGYSTPQRVVPLDVFLRIWDEATGGAPVVVPQVSVSVGSLFTVENAVRQIREALPGCTVVSVPAAAAEGAVRGGFPESWSRWRSQPGDSSVMAGQVTLPSGVKLLTMALTCLLGALVVAANSLVMLTERRREIGILRAVGATRRDIMVMVLAEVAVVTLFGSALGYGLIRLAVIHNQLSGSASLATVGLTALADGLKVLAATLACAVVLGLAPALRSTSVSTMDVLREE